MWITLNKQHTVATWPTANWTWDGMFTLFRSFTVVAKRRDEHQSKRELSLPEENLWEQLQSPLETNSVEFKSWDLLGILADIYSFYMWKSQWKGINVPVFTCLLKIAICAEIKTFLQILPLPHNYHHQLALLNTLSLTLKCSYHSTITLASLNFSCIQGSPQVHTMSSWVTEVVSLGWGGGVMNVD